MLKSEIGASDYAEEIGFAQEFDPDESAIHITLQLPELPVEWALLAADCLQNLRCALNYVAWELAIWNLARIGERREPDGTTQFPINTVIGKFSDFRVADICPEHVAPIRRLQPNGREHLLNLTELRLQTMSLSSLEEHIAAHPLARLAEFTNDDKHRLIPAVVPTPQGIHAGNYTPINCTINRVGMFMVPTEDRPAEWAKIWVTPTGSGEPEVQVNDRVEPKVRFSGLSVDDLLIIGRAVKEIIYFFAPAIEDDVILAPFEGM